jgi:hypothetical protein
MTVIKKSQGDSGESADILRDILITQLGIAGVSQKSIRQIVGCDIYRVNRIVKHLKNVKRKEQPGPKADSGQ